MKRNKAGKRGLIFILFALIGTVLTLIYFRVDTRGKQPPFRLAKIDRGPIISSVSSSGTLNAVTTVQVGSQVSGQIKALFADFNSDVQKDQVIARIDPVNFEARIRLAEAELAVSKANVSIQRAAVKRSDAELQNAQAALVAAKAQTEKAAVADADAKRDLGRKKALHKGAIISQREIDQAEALYDQALAQRNTMKAQE
ncbi:MAG: biotin/lipoyl-binding protein, partial [Pseudomonadota bacterium]